MSQHFLIRKLYIDLNGAAIDAVVFKYTTHGDRNKIIEQMFAL